MEIGIGVSQGHYEGHKAIFVVQEFGTPAQQQMALSTQPTPVQQAAVPAPAPSQAKAPASSARVAGNSISAPQTPAAPPAVKAATQQQPPAPSYTINLQSGQVSFVGDNIEVTANVSGPAVKVLAYFGQQAVMLQPQGQSTWNGLIPASVLGQNPLSVNLEAFNMQGQSARLQLADFSPDTQTNFNLSGSTPQAFVTFLGHTFNPAAAENSFYLLFAALMLTSLVLAIGIKRHIQHLPLIANTSFVVVLAVMLWLGG